MLCAWSWTAGLALCPPGCRSLRRRRGRGRENAKSSLRWWRSLGTLTTRSTTAGQPQRTPSARSLTPLAGSWKRRTVRWSPCRRNCLFPGPFWRAAASVTSQARRAAARQSAPVAAAQALCPMVPAGVAPPPSTGAAPPPSAGAAPPPSSGRASRGSSTGWCREGRSLRGSSQRRRRPAASACPVCTTRWRACRSPAPRSSAPWTAPPQTPLGSSRSGRGTVPSATPLSGGSAGRSSRTSCGPPPGGWSSTAPSRQGRMPYIIRAGRALVPRTPPLSCCMFVHHRPISFYS
mmetsp:Transcript_13097/g.36848  ORF Transcript_13097/g.36848 Transcript_13097/m.36848 type:complete len:291 (+) Transcript_13097:1638-2510(+)